jgi:hypothetical protein
MNKHFFSIDTLMRDLEISQEQAKKIHKILAYFRENPHYNYDYSLIENAMRQIDAILDTCGVESIHLNMGFEIEGLREEDTRDKYWWDCVLLYCNTGETYQTTILYDVNRDRFLIGSWGDWYERNVIYLEKPE